MSNSECVTSSERDGVLSFWSVVGECSNRKRRRRKDVKVFSGDVTSVFIGCSA